MSETRVQKQQAAFFDVDYTVLSNNSASLFVKFLRQEGQVGIGIIIKTLYYLVLYKLNLLDFENLAEKQLMKYAGEPEQEMIDLCDRWFQEMVVDYIYPEAVDLIQSHKDKGHEVALLTAASIYLGKPLADHLEVEHCLCNRLETDDQGRFTGRLIRPISYGAGKIDLAVELAREKEFELENSYYYSDSITDLPVLERFGIPVAVNPDPLLRKEAKKRGWQIIDFAKMKK